MANWHSVHFLTRATNPEGHVGATNTHTLAVNIRHPMFSVQVFVLKHVGSVMIFMSTFQNTFVRSLRTNFNKS